MTVADRDEPTVRRIQRGIASDEITAEVNERAMSVVGAEDSDGLIRGPSLPDGTEVGAHASRCESHTVGVGIDFEKVHTAAGAGISECVRIGKFGLLSGLTPKLGKWSEGGVECTAGSGVDVATQAQHGCEIRGYIVPDVRRLLEKPHGFGVRSVVAEDGLKGDDPLECRGRGLGGLRFGWSVEGDAAGRAHQNPCIAVARVGTLGLLPWFRGRGCGASYKHREQ